MKRTSGFTIVELLIVIVVIGILAAITIVAYNGIQGRANDTAIQSDLINNAKKLEIYRLDNDAYPTGDATTLTAELTAADLKFTKGSYAPATGTTSTVVYLNNDNGADFALMAVSKSGKTFYYSSKVGVTKEWTDTHYTFPGSITYIKSSLGMNGSPNSWIYTPAGWVSWAK